MKYTPKRSKTFFFSNFLRTNISHNPHKKESAMKFSQLKIHVPHLKFCILLYRIYRNYRRANFTCMSVCTMYFKIMSKVAKYTRLATRYNYTHDHFISISFLRFFLRGVVQNLTLPRAPVTLATPLQGRKSWGDGGGVPPCFDMGDYMSFIPPHDLTLKSVVFCSGKLIMFYNVCFQGLIPKHHL